MSATDNSSKSSRGSTHPTTTRPLNFTPSSLSLILAYLPPLTCTIFHNTTRSSNNSTLALNTNKPTLITLTPNPTPTTYPHLLPQPTPSLSLTHSSLSHPSSPLSRASWTNSARSSTSLTQSAQWRKQTRINKVTALYP